MRPLLYPFVNALKNPEFIGIRGHVTRRISFQPYRSPRLSYSRFRFLSTQNGPKKSPDGKDDPETVRVDKADVDKHYENLSLPVSLPGLPGGQGGTGGGLFRITSSPMFDAALTSLVGISISEDAHYPMFKKSRRLIITIVFIGGVAYIMWYKWNVLQKVSLSYSPKLSVLILSK